MKQVLNRTFINAALLAAVFCLTSCPPPPEGGGGPSAGFYIINEGAFGNNNASISYYERDRDAVNNNVFLGANNRPLGDQAQSLTVHRGYTFIVVQNSNKIEVTNVDRLTSVKTITDGIESPRYFVGVDGQKGYVTDWGSDGVSGTVKVVAIPSLVITKSIAIGKGPNKMLVYANRVYVANSGGFAKDNTVKVIDRGTDQVISTITVSDNPTSMQFDKDGNLWVASAGNIVYKSDFSIDETLSTKPALTRLSQEGAELSKFTFEKINYGNLTQLAISPRLDILYYNYEGAIYSLNVTNPSVSSSPLIDKPYYGLGVDPSTGDIIGGVAPNFTSAGTIEINGSDGVLKKTFTVGIAPNGFTF